MDLYEDFDVTYGTIINEKNFCHCHLRTEEKVLSFLYKRIWGPPHSSEFQKDNKTIYFGRDVELTFRWYLMIMILATHEMKIFDFGRGCSLPFTIYPG